MTLGLSDGLRAIRRGTAQARSTLLGHPRHAVLACVVAGLALARQPLAVGAVVVGLLLALRRLPLVLVLLAAGLAGGVAAQMRLEALDRTRLSPHFGRGLWLSVYLLEHPRRSPSGAARALAAVAAGPARGERVMLRFSRRGRVPAAAPGDELRVGGRLVVLRPRDAWMRRRGAHAQLIAGAAVATGRRRGGAAGLMDRLRAGSERAVVRGLDPPRAALARGMVLGQDEALDQAERDAFRDSGLAHLLAASGQNVLLLVALALPLFAGLGLGLRGRLAGALTLIALYVPLAGAGPSIQRAGVMGAAGVVAAMAGRPASRWYALLLAGAATLAANPRAVEDPGWQLSFAAVIAIALLSARLRNGLAARRVPRALAEAVAVTAAATVGTAPLLVMHFERLSLVSLPVNILAAPAVAPVMWLGMVAALTGAALPAAAELVNAIAQFPLAYLGWLARAGAGLPMASVPLSAGFWPLVGGVCGALAAGLAAWSRWRRARAPLLGLAIAALAAAVLQARPPPPPDPGTLVVWFFDVGQGDATLVQRGGASVLFDTGPPGAPLLERLRGAGVRRLDALVVTHAQADHEGEAVSVLRRMPVGLLVDGGDGAPTPQHLAILAAARARRVPRLVPEAGQLLRLGPLELRVLWPRREPPQLHAGEDPNLRALVVHLRDGDFDLLLPADAESEVTAGLQLPEVEALKVAHHGSEDPGLPELLDRLRPRLAVIEVGRHNTYGHPTRQALSALRSVPLVHRTDRDGTVRLTVDRGRMAIATDP